MQFNHHISHERRSVLLQPPLGISKCRARVLNEAPEFPGMIRLPQVHELVDQNVLADLCGHEQQPEIQGDVAGRGAGAPPRTLAADADAGHLEAKSPREREKLWRELARRALPQLAFDLRRPCRRQSTGTLLLGPGEVPLRETERFGARSTARDRDAKGAIRPDAHHVAAGAAHSYEMDDEVGGLGRRLKRQPELCTVIRRCTS